MSFISRNGLRDVYVCGYVVFCEFTLSSLWCFVHVAGDTQTQWVSVSKWSTQWPTYIQKLMRILGPVGCWCSYYSNFLICGSSLHFHIQTVGTGTSVLYKDSFQVSLRSQVTASRNTSPQLRPLWCFFALQAFQVGDGGFPDQGGGGWKPEPLHMPWPCNTCRVVRGDVHVAHHTVLVSLLRVKRSVVSSEVTRTGNGKKNTIFCMCSSLSSDFICMSFVKYFCNYSIRMHYMSAGLHVTIPSCSITLAGSGRAC